MDDVKFREWEPEDEIWSCHGDDGTEFLKLLANGNIYYRGKLIANDKEFAEQTKLSVKTGGPYSISVNGKGIG